LALHTRLREKSLTIASGRFRLPTAVIESGWSESKLQLYCDRDLWLRGGQGSVEVVLIIKWSKNAARLVKGTIEVFDLDAQGNVRRPRNGKLQNKVYWS
jgi:hypothetical protein